VASGCVNGSDTLTGWLYTPSVEFVGGKRAFPEESRNISKYRWASNSGEKKWVAQRAKLSEDRESYVEIKLVEIYDHRACTAEAFLQSAKISKIVELPEFIKVYLTDVTQGKPLKVKVTCPPIPEPMS
jgi:hypothetical protein